MLENVIKLEPPPNDAGRLRCPKCHTPAGCECKLAPVTNLELAAAAIAENPNRSDSVIADELGMSRATVQRARESGCSQHEQSETRTGRDGKQYPAKRKAETTEPKPMDKKLSDKAREAIRLEKRGVPMREIRAAVGLPLHVYPIVRDAVLLADSDDLSAEESAAVKQALRDMDRNGRVGKAAEIIKPIADRIWANRRRVKRFTEAELAGFVEAIASVERQFERMADRSVPPLSDSQAETALQSLEAVKRLAAKLAHNIRESCQCQSHSKAPIK